MTSLRVVDDVTHDVTREDVAGAQQRVVARVARDEEAEATALGCIKRERGREGNTLFRNYFIPNTLAAGDEEAEAAALGCIKGKETWRRVEEKFS